MNEDLHAILRTIREVEDNLERRHARAEGTILMIWGLVGFSIFGFYQLVELSPDPYHAALGPFVNWAWLLPMALGYAATGLVGARLGRLGADAERQRRLRRGLIPGLVVALLVTTLILTGRYQLVYGGVTLICGLAPILLSWDVPPTPARRVTWLVGGALCGLGIVLLVLWAAVWAAGVAALGILLGYLLLGTVRYRLGG